MVSDASQDGGWWTEEITPDNCGAVLKKIREVSGMSRRELAGILGVSESTVYRIETGISTPSQEFINRLKALNAIGYHRFSHLSAAEKEKISEAVALAGGAVAGLGGAMAAVSASGVVAGLSAAGISSGLAAIGGTMIAGIGIVAAIPIAGAAVGYGLVKSIKKICEANNLSCEEVDGRYEIRKQP